MNEGRDVEVVRVATRGHADELALVLVAEGVGATVERSAEGWSLRVAPEAEARAREALAAYQDERARAGPETTRRALPAAGGRGGVGPALGVSAALLLFFVSATGARRPGVAWFERGAAVAERVVAGEWFRVVTALTLHADIGHVVANALAGALFFAAAFRRFGSGLGSLLVLAAGALGNAANAWLHGAGHSVVGASTAVFGAVGLLGGAGLVRHHSAGARGWRAGVPVAAAVALLALLGTGKERVDIWAHLLGFAVGLAIGVPAALAARGAPGRAVQIASGGLAAGVVAAAWYAALAPG